MGESRRWKQLVPVLSVLQWLVTGGITFVVTAVGVILHFPPLALVLLGLGTLLLILAGFLAVRQKALAEQLQPSGGAFASAVALTPSIIAEKIPATGVPMEIQFDVHNGQTLEVPTSRSIGAVRLLQPRRESKIVEKFPRRFRLGRIMLIWPQYLIVKALTDRGMVVEGVRTTGVNIRMELYPSEPTS